MPNWLSSWDFFRILRCYHFLHDWNQNLQQLMHQNPWQKEVAIFCLTDSKYLSFFNKLINFLISLTTCAFYDESKNRICYLYLIKNVECFSGVNTINSESMRTLLINIRSHFLVMKQSKEILVLKGCRHWELSIHMVEDLAPKYDLLLSKLDFYGQVWRLLSLM